MTVAIHDIVEEERALVVMFMVNIAHAAVEGCRC
jgi:hypothetical protein